MNLSFYTIDPDYCDYLREADHRVPYTHDEKANRPFVGVVFSVGRFNYYAPLTSPKKKHLTMKNAIDFTRIKDGVYGAINFNNMIPAPISCLKKVNVRPAPSDTKEQRQYKALLANQLSWCNSNKEEIIGKAEKLYDTICNGRGWPRLAERCCFFPALEERCVEYVEDEALLKLAMERLEHYDPSTNITHEELMKKYGFTQEDIDSVGDVELE